MKKRRNIMIADIERWRAAGLGSGRGSNYRPGLTIRDVASSGHKSRPPECANHALWEALKYRIAAPFFPGRELRPSEHLK